MWWNKKLPNLVPTNPPIPDLCLRNSQVQVPTRSFLKRLLACTLAKQTPTSIRSLTVSAQLSQVFQSMQQENHVKNHTLKININSTEIPACRRKSTTRSRLGRCWGSRANHLKVCWRHVVIPLVSIWHRFGITWAHGKGKLGGMWG
jgi:hypothetical protein